MRRFTIAAAAAGLLVLAGCSDIKDTLNDWTRQVVHVTYRADTLQLTGDACADAFAVDDVLSSAGGYANHVRSVKVTQAEYVVSANQTPQDGRVELFVKVDSDLDAQAIAESQEIPADATVSDYEPVNWLGDGLDRFNGVVHDAVDGGSASYSVCARFDPAQASADLSIRLRVTFAVTVVPFT